MFLEIKICRYESYKCLYLTWQLSYKHENLGKAVR